MYSSIKVVGPKEREAVVYLVRLELVSLPADVATVAGLLGEPHELLQQRLLGLDLYE